MKTITRILFIISILIAFTACDKDGDTIYLNGLNANKLSATQSSVVLSVDKSKDIVLSLAWTRDALITNDPNVSAPNLIKQTMQIAVSKDFVENVYELNETSLSRAFTGNELNSIAKNLGLTPDEATPVYFRIEGRTGSNMEPVYSNIEEVNITSYFIDMTIGTILNADNEETGKVLHALNADGVYSGFMGASAWYNFYLREGDGLIWGNDGVDGSPFLMSCEDTKWNYWFPGQSGCYYVEVNTPKKVWSALYVPTLNVTGGIVGEMIFDRPNEKWMLPFEATTTGNITISVEGEGKQYDYSTGVDDEAAITTPIAFSQSNGSLVFGKEKGDLVINVPQTGSMVLIIDLSDYRNLKAEVTTAGDLPTPVLTTIYLSGIDDLINGWTFDNQLKLYHEDNETYAGVAYSKSEWGYNIFKEAWDWSNKFTFVSGDATNGTMEWNGDGGNLPAPAEGLYLFDVSLKESTYKTTAIGNTIYYSGLNDDWSFYPIAETDVKGVYASEITITKASEWGFKIYLFDGDWDNLFGGSNGEIYYKSNNGITDDKDLSVGTYTLTVDLTKGTYSIK